MNLKVIAVAATAALMSGCIAQYKNPDIEKSASIEFINSGENDMFLELYNGAQQCTDREIAGAIPANTKKVIKVKSDTDIAFTVISASNKRNVINALGGVLAMAITDGMYRDCSPSVKFIPKNEGNYAFYMSSLNGECKYKITEINSGNEELLKSPEDFEIRKWKRAWGESGPWCEKK